MNRPDMRNIKNNIEVFEHTILEQSQQMYDYIMFLEKNKDTPPCGGQNIQDYYTEKLIKKEPVFFSEKQYIQFNFDGSIEGENELGKFSISADGIIRILNNQKCRIETTAYSSSFYYGSIRVYYPIRCVGIKAKNVFIKLINDSVMDVVTVMDISAAGCVIKGYSTPNIIEGYSTTNVTPNTTTIYVGYELLAYKEK